MRAESPNPAVPVADRDRAGPMNKHVSIRATCLKRSALSTTKEGNSYSRSIPPVRRARSGTHTPPCGPGVAGASSPSDRAPAAARRLRARYADGAGAVVSDTAIRARDRYGTAGGRRGSREADAHRRATASRLYCTRAGCGLGLTPPTTAYPQHDPGGCPDGHATGARARPRLRLRSPGRDRVPGRTVPAADTPRRRAAAETATVAGAPAHAAPPGCNVHHTARGRATRPGGIVYVLAVTGHRM